MAGHGIQRLVLSFSTVESIWLEKFINKDTFTVSLDQKKGNKRAYAPVYIIGDFNYTEIKWKIKTANNQCSLHLLEGYKSHRGEQLITFPTRY